MRAGTSTIEASELRIGIAGCGTSARIHLDRLLTLDGVAVVGCADSDLAAANALADWAASRTGQTVPAFDDHRELIRTVVPDALAIFSPPLAHYRLAMDALQAGCHVFIEKPLTTNVQEAADIVALAHGRDLKVAVGHQYRLCPSLNEARQRIRSGIVGSVRLVNCILARPWLTTLGPKERDWRAGGPLASGGILSDAGDHVIDALLWTTGQVAHEVGAIQNHGDLGIDLVTAAAIRLADGTPATLAISGVSPGCTFMLDYFGERGRLRATDQTLEQALLDAPWQDVDLPPTDQTIDGNFVAALTKETPLCCSADQALDTVRLLEAIARSAATGQIVRLI
jgi:predicted dehydrogenase